MSSSPPSQPKTLVQNLSGVSVASAKARRGILWALEDAISDDEYAEALASIAFGQWPKRRARDGAPAKPSGAHEAVEGPPDGTHRMAAWKMIGDRKYGKPMQAVMIKAELEARSRVVENAADAIDVEALDGAAASVIESALRRALMQGTAPTPTPRVIDAHSEEKTP